LNGDQLVAWPVGVTAQFSVGLLPGTSYSVALMFPSGR
jgi:hypothetical protein